MDLMRPVKLNVDPRVTLLDLLRDNAGLTGTKKGCDHGQCGACTVLGNGIHINSCLSLAATHDRDGITTIEGLAEDGQLNALQAAFLEISADVYRFGTDEIVRELNAGRRSPVSGLRQDDGLTGTCFGSEVRMGVAAMLVGVLAGV